MSKRYKSRPTPLASVLAAVVGTIMLVIVIALFSTLGSQGVRVPMPAPVAMFIGLWVLLVVGGIVYHITNAAKPGGVPTEIIEDESPLPSPSSRSTTERLQELEDLRSRDLVSDVEYEAKRREILEKL